MAISLDTPVALTKLEAVNLVLRARGIAPATTLGSGARRTTIEALEQLGETNVNIQSENWNFNRENRLKLGKNTSGEIVAPNGLVRVKPTYTDAYKNITVRDGKIYDLDNSTFVWTQDLYVEATILLPFEDLPQPIRWYVAVKAAWMHGNSTVPGDASIRPTEVQLSMAKTNAMSFDSDSSNKNLRANPHFRRMRGNR